MTTAHTDRRARILLVSLTPFFGGGEAHYSKLARLLEPRYALASIAATPRVREAFADLNLKVYDMENSAKHGALLRYHVAATTLYRAVRETCPDVVHLNGQAESYLAPLAKMLGLPVVTTRHTEFGDYIAPCKRSLLKQTLRCANRIVCVSEAVKRQLSQLLTPSRLAVIPNWLDELPTAFPRAPVRAGHFFRLLFVGRIVREKGIFELVSAVRAIPRVSLDVVGDGPELRELKSTASGMAINFHGFQPIPHRFFREADLLVAPSHREGQGQVPIEAMAHGLPCLLSDIDALRETADNGAAAELFRCGDIADLITKIERLRANPERLAELSRAGMHRVRTSYSAEQVRGQYFQLFDSLIVRQARHGSTLHA